MSFCPAGKKTNSAPPPNTLAGLKGHIEAGEKEGKREGKGKKEGTKKTGENTPEINLWLRSWNRQQINAVNITWR